MERKALGKMFKLLFPVMVSAIIGLSSIGGSVVKAHADETEVTGNAYTLIDDNEKKFAYATLQTDPYDEASDLNGRERRIIGFDTPNVEMASIGRLGITISYYTYPWWDLFHVNPISNSEFYLVRSTDVDTYAGTIVFLDSTGFAVTQDGGFNLKSIGTISGDFMAYQEDCLTVYNQSTTSPLIMGDSDFYTRDWYVVLPIAHTFHEVIISIDAFDTLGNHYSDGLDEDGLPPHDPDFGDYITLSPSTARSVYFTDSDNDSNISRLEVHGLVSGTVLIQAGRYNYQDNAFGTMLYSHEFASDGALLVNIDMPFEWNVVATFIGDGALTASVKVFYESGKAAVLYNVLGSDGTEGSEGDDPDDGGLTWWQKLLAFLAEFGSLVLVGVIVYLLIFKVAIPLTGAISRFKLARAMKHGKRRRT